MSWFKFDWFSSKERQELQALRHENEVLAQNNETLRRQTEAVKIPPAQAATETATGKPYKNLYFAGDIITVVLRDGTLISKKADKALFELVRNSVEEKHVLDLLSDQSVLKPQNDQKEVKETAQERDLVLKNLSILSYNPEFEVKGREVFLKGVSWSLPAVIIASFIEICEKVDKYDHPDTRETFDVYYEQYEALKMFTIKLALNGLEQSRNDLLRFVQLNDVRITSNGNLVLYRRIVSKEDGNKALIAFISQEYYKIKKKWKKSPDNYYVWAEDDGSFTLYDHEPQNDGIGSNLGSLSELYKKLPEMEDNTYTAAHDNRVDIRIGAIYQIDEKKINLDNGLCAAGGLHAAAVDYNYSGFGDTPVVVLVNPSKAITVPVGESGKLRTTEMFIACVNDKPQGTHFDDEALSAFDEEYNNASIKELEDAIRDKSFKPATVVNEVAPIKLTDLETIKTMLQARVKKIQF